VSPAYDLDDFDWAPPIDDRVAPPRDDLAPAASVALGDLRLSPKMSALVGEGFREGNGYKSRSEADAAAIRALVAAGHDDATIRGVFESFAIGAKYREKGRDGERYLARTIAFARHEPAPSTVVHVGADEARGAVGDGFRLVALDWPALERDGLPEIEILEPPYLVRGARILGVGPTESAKSIYALATAARLTRRGVDVAYLSQENPLTEDLRRLSLLQPDWTHLRFFHDQQLDLAASDHVDVLAEAAAGCALIVVDTLSACWSGDENDNGEMAAFFDRVLASLIRATGATVFLLDHTGNPQALVRRRGVSAPRGASAKSQKADVVLEFIPEGRGAFRIEHPKNRMGGRKQPPRSFRVTDTDDEAIEVIEVDAPGDAKVVELAERMVELVSTAGSLTTRKLRDAVGGGRELQDAAFERIAAEDPPRIRSVSETVTTDSGRQRAKVWRPTRGHE
jgi:hypothetical protein